MPLSDRFAHTDRITYLDHAASGVLSKTTRAAVSDFLDVRSGIASDDVGGWLAFEPILTSARERTARLAGCRADQIAFTAHTSDALSLLAEGLPLQPGDRIAIPDCEFPSNVYPFQHLERKGIRVDLIPTQRGIVTLDAIERAMTPRTRLVSVSWVQFLSGYRLDVAAVAEIAHVHGAWFSVDAIQGAGALPMDVTEWNADWVSCGTQKWLMGMRGVGWAYVSDALLDVVTPKAGWLGGPVDWNAFTEYDLQFWPDARRFEIGTHNHGGLVALDAALGEVEHIGRTECLTRTLAASARIARELDALGLQRYGSSEVAHASGIVTVEVPNAEVVRERLAQAGVVVSVRNGLLRVSPHWYTTDADMDRLVEVLKKAQNG